MERTEIVSLYKNTPADGTVVTVCGWAKNIRDSKNIGFIALSDGGCFKTLQVVLEAGKLENYEQVIHTGLYSSLRIVGRIVLTPQAKQPFELNADSVEILGDCPADEYPLQKKKMSMEYLRTMPTLRPRTNTFNAAFRVRSVAAYAIHKFFQENGFIYSHSPLLTASDCEGAGEMFQVTTLDLQNVPKNEDGTVDYSQDFFEKPVFVTDYPKEIKSFYMKMNADGKTVAAADMLVPGIGELIGGSQREENYDKLVARMDELGMDKTNYEWYLNLRKFGGVEHAGYGLGFERMIMYLTGIQNIRDVLPFPRTAYGF